MKLKSSSIYYALFLSVIIGLFLGGMILFAGINKQFESQIDVQDKLRNNAYSGIEYGIANHKELNVQNKEIQLFGDGLDSVLVIKEKWGAFDVISSNAHQGKLHFQKSTLSGQIRGSGDPSLYVVDLGRSVSVCGSTRIEGKCMIPKAGIERAYIEGQNYQGNQLIYGSKSNSGKAIPPINNGFIQEVQNINGELRKWDNPDSVCCSFFDKPIHFISDGVISFSDNVLDGHVYIESRDSIFISSDTDLDQVIVKSRVVYVQNGFKGSLQIYATEKIVLEEGVQLLYPSVLGIIEETFPEEKNAEIIINSKSQVIGSVFAISEAPNFRKPVQITIGEDAQVNGLIYNQGRTQLKGTVNGSLYTKKFYLETPSSKYENHLLNATIKNDLPEDFVFIPIIESREPLTKILWLQ